MAETKTIAPGDSPSRLAMVVLLLLVLIPISFNAIALFPELSLSIPSLNDDAVHYLLVQRASEALANGENPFDHWSPELDFGFPQMLYYQHLPHLAVVFLHRLLLKQVDLLTLFNLIRYLLLVGFPLTVYWSMRQLGFSVVAGTVAAASATLISGNERYGFEYDSYIWRGYGMYTQLWAAHLSFITLACLNRLIERGRDHVTAILACSALALSHLMYAYMIAPGALVLFLVGLNHANARQRLARMAITAAGTTVITAYFWFPFLRFKAYLSASPFEFSWKYDSFGAGSVLTWLVNGDLLDYGRLPVLTLLLALGIAFAVSTRTRPAKLALALFLLWLALFFGRPTWGRLIDLLPLHERMHFHRFIGGVHLAAILLIGLGGEWLWRQLAPIPERWRSAVAGLIFLFLLLPAMLERQQDYALNTEKMELTKATLDADEDARSILSALAAQLPGRASAGRRKNWGEKMSIGNLYFYDLLTFHRFPAITPYGNASLNSDLVWYLDDQNPAHYDLFNIKYVVAPRSLATPSFLRPIKETSRYTLYQAETGGYARFVSVSRRINISSQSSLFAQNQSWLSSADPAEGRFIRYDYPAGKGASGDSATPGCPGGGKIGKERVLPGRIDLRVECQAPSTLVLKMTYHPNWRITVDGREVRPFMVSPSFIGLEVPAGSHHVRAEYHSGLFKIALLILSACALVGLLCFRRRLAELDARLSVTSRRRR